MVKFKTFKLSDFFKIFSGKQPDIHNRFDTKKENMVNTITGATTNNGVNFYSYSEKYNIDELTISKDGEYAGTVFLQTKPFILGGHVLGVFGKFYISNEAKLYIASSVMKRRELWRGADRPSVQKKRLENLELELPVTSDGEPDFEYMSEYVKRIEAEYVKRIEAEYVKRIEAYLTVLGYPDVESVRLTQADKEVLSMHASAGFEKYELRYLFDHIVQGRRLKKDDQIKGNIPFIMSGTTNLGIVDHVSNPNKVAPKNSITVDIFGNSFYRNFEYGYGDDTGAYWNEDNKYNPFVMEYISVVIKKTLLGKYSYGKKLRSSKSLDIKIKLPIDENKLLNIELMENYIKVIQKKTVLKLKTELDNKLKLYEEASK
ncbi:hypothetical protein G7084_03795 [Weissella coleopterorum]|uniref:Type I restriction modification DNA specificity domain-containing protein n=1 Tax=Weissella coleopterorum TaxID=2714949 RepID=A0A6G8AZX0_9LACO|nr:restriction endonuclease subunit S [Weissella coleopterorum]QIL50512.1 hypothetical protein G7084_03795 [Weissella coleopterorum]